METLRTTNGEELNVAPNYSKRTFTIKTEWATYRTFPMSKDEFHSCTYNTANDWKQFLKSDDYYKVK